MSCSFAGLPLRFVASGPKSLVCKPKLSYRQCHQNIITKMVHHRVRDVVLVLPSGPGVAECADPTGGNIEPLSPARRCAQLGGWDPYNVTEDCDLGIRMFREGYEVKVLESVTLEEANSDFVNWVKQRSRWYKGYLQTFLIHLRSPGHGHEGNELEKAWSISVRSSAGRRPSPC